MNFSDYKTHYISTLQLGWPIVVGQLGTVVLSVADTLMIGHHSTSELAASSFVNNVLNMVIMFGTGFSYGLTPLIGKLYGQGDVHGVGQALRSSLIANMLMSILMLIIMVSIGVFVHRMGQPSELISLIRSYLFLLTASLPLIMIFNAYKNAADAVRQTSIGMWIMVAGNALNIGLNYVLINGCGPIPELGLIGAGWATIIARILMTLSIIIYFQTSSHLCIFTNGLHSPTNWQIILKLNKIGWPIALQLGMETAAFSLSSVMMGWIGKLALAAHQVLITLSTVTFMIFYGIGAAVSIRVSNFNGQGDNVSLHRAAHAGFHIIVFIAFVLCVCMAIGRQCIGRFFSNDADVVQLVAILMMPMLAYQIGDGLQVNYANALRGIADVKAMAVIAFVAYFVVSLPIGYLMAFRANLGALGVWMAFPFGLTTAGILYMYRFEKYKL